MYLCRREFIHVQFYLRFLYTRFPHLHCLHADSITRAIHMMYFTRYFHYLRNPYPQNDHYPQFHYTRIKSPHKNERSVAFKIRQNPFSAGALPRTPLGELTTLPRPPSRLERGHPSPYLTPLGTDPPSALTMRPPQKSSQIQAYECSQEGDRIHPLRSERTVTPFLFLLL